MSKSEIPVKTLLRVILTVSIVLSLVQPTLAQTEPRNYSKDYDFRVDWFTGNIPIWRSVLAPYKGKPNLHYLEVGVFEGRSALWMLENILTHPTSTLTGIDLFPDDLKERFLSNLQKSGFSNKVTTIVGRSQIQLRKLKPNSYDIIYIDGGHTADEVLADIVLSWELLKVGGMLMLDDYLWGKKEGFSEELRPQIAVDAFLSAYRNYLEVVHLEYQVFVRKRKGPAHPLPKIQ